jgi:hypothetical protein
MAGLFSKYGVPFLEAFGSPINIASVWAPGIGTGVGGAMGMMHAHRVNQQRGGSFGRRMGRYAGWGAGGAVGGRAAGYAAGFGARFGVSKGLNIG